MVSRLPRRPVGLGNIRPDETGLSGSVANVVMSPTTDRYRPMRSTYFDQAALAAGNVPDFLQYLLWKVEDKEAYIPELDEVREEVVDAWKRLKARQLAENSARDLAAKVQTTGDDPWGSALSATDKALVIETDPFTWMNRLGEFMTTTVVNKLDNVGGEFMQAVFTTPVGDVSIAPNSNYDVFYVFRVVEVSPDDENLQMRFNADPLKSGPRQLAFDESQRLFSSWIQGLEQQLQLEWQMDVGQFN